MNSGLPYLAITMGDAAGIGPEIVIKLLEQARTYEICYPVVVGDYQILQSALRGQSTESKLRLHEVTRYETKHYDPFTVPVFQPGESLKNIQSGILSSEAGRGAVEFVRAAAALAKEGKVQGIVTAPLNKAAMHKAGFTYPGHTELLAQEFGVHTYSLVLSARNRFIFHVTTHVSLRQALQLITTEKVLAQVKLAHYLAEALGRADEQIAVAGVNPHAGEGGLFGDEEARIIQPAITQAQSEGIPVIGPLPADMMFPLFANGRYSFVIAMYHDQGHGVFKSLYFNEGINVTVGLPTIRTSVDHGTAFDIAGKGVASEESLAAALELAAKLGPKWGQISSAANRSMD